MLKISVWLSLFCTCFTCFGAASSSASGSGPAQITVRFGPESALQEMQLSREVYAQSRMLSDLVGDVDMLDESMPLREDLRVDAYQRMFAMMREVTVPSESNGVCDIGCVNGLNLRHLRILGSEDFGHTLSVAHYLEVRSEAAVALAVRCHELDMLTEASDIALYKRYHCARVRLGMPIGALRIAGGLSVHDILKYNARPALLAPPVDGVCDLSHLQLSSLEGLEGVVGIHTVTTLLLHNNNLTELPVLPESLTSLDVSCNNLHRAPELLGSHLFDVSLKSNRITDIESLIRLEVLRVAMFRVVMLRFAAEHRTPMRSRLDISDNYISSADVGRIIAKYAGIADVTVFPQYTASYVGKRMLQVGAYATVGGVLYLLSKQLK